MTGRLVTRATPEQVFPHAPVTVLGEGETVATPGLAALPLDPACRHLGGETYRTPRVTTTILPGVLYYPDQNRLLTDDRRLLEQADQVPFRLHDLDWRPLLGMDVRPLSGLFTTLRSFRDNYYHTLVDNLPLLHALQQATGEPVPAPPIRLLLALPLSRAEEFFLERLLPPGVEVVPVEPGVLYRMERYVFVSLLSRRYAGYLPRATVAWLRERAGVAPAPAARRRLFISRRDAGKGRHILNEEAMMQALAPVGFERVVLEQMPPADQVQYFSEAECVVGAHGAGLANLLFASRAGVVELFPQATLWPHFYLLSRSGDHRYRYVCHDARGRDDDFRADVPAVIRCVAEVLAAPAVP
ncbi:MAG: glycosyltransferase family 61 protein [Candidatus Binatia bacterium]